VHIFNSLNISAHEGGRRSSPRRPFHLTGDAHVTNRQTMNHTQPVESY
jgi:hypothetical protein